MSRTTDHVIDHMNLMQDNIALAASGPLSMSEADLAALETRGRELVAAGKLVYQHMRHCDAYGSMEQLQAIETLLKYIGIYDEVVNPKHITQPQAEMAVHEGE